jgi:PAS domain S-box-containing protein
VPVRILLIDDNPDDRTLTARELRGNFPGCELRETGTEKGFARAVLEEAYDLVVSDYHLLWSDGLKILRRVRQRYPDVPVIIFSGTGDVKIAARALKEGADDYIIKTGGRMPQLIMASRLALERSLQRQAAAQAETRYRTLSESLPIGWLQIGPGGIVLDANARMAQILGYATRAEMLADKRLNFYENTEARDTFHRRIQTDTVLDGYEMRLRRRDDRLLWCRFFAHPILTPDGKPAYEAVIEDIQARKDAELSRQSNEQEVRRVNESLRVVLDTAPTPIIGVARDGTIDFVWNRAAEQLLGKTRAEVIGHSIFELIPEMAARSDRIAPQIADPVKFSNRVVTHTRPDGRILHLSVNVSPFFGPDEKPAGMIAVLVDVTEQRETETALRISENRLSLIHESVSDLLILLGVEGGEFRVILVNRAVCEAFGQPSEAFTGQWVMDVISAPLAANTAAKCREALQTGRRSFFISSTRLPGSRRLTTENTLTPIFDSAGRCTHILLVARDIQARIKSEMEIQRALHALRDSEHRYRALAEAAHDMIYIIDRDLRVQYVNSYACSRLRRPAVELVGQPMKVMFQPAIAERQASVLGEVFARGNPLYREGLAVFPEGEVWLGTWLVPMRDSQDAIVSVMGVSRDINERVRAEQALRESEEQYRTLVQTSPDAILVHDKAAFITFANQQALEILGCASQDELRGTDILDHVVPEEHKLAEKHLRSLNKNGSLRDAVHTLRRRDGSTIPVEINASLMFDSEHRTKAIVSVLRDITERKRGEQAVLEGEARFRAIFERAAIGMVLLDSGRRITDCNTTLCDMLGYTREELSPQSLDAVTLAEDRDGDASLFERILKGRLDHYQVERRLVRKDGALAWCRLTVSAVRGVKEELLFLAGMIEDITKQREAEQVSRQSGEALRRYAGRLEILHEIDRAIQQADSTDQIARVTLDHISRLVPCQRSSLVIFEKEAGTALILDAHSPSETELAKGRVVPFDDYGRSIDTLKTGALYSVEDLLTIEAPTAIQRRLLREGIRTYLSIPLITQGELIGALNIGSGVPGAFTREHADIAGEVAGLLAVAIQQARLLEQVRRHAMELESIAALNHDLRLALTRQEMTEIITRHISKALQCEFVGLLSSDPATEELFFERVTGEYRFLEGYRIPPGIGMTGQTISSNQPYYNNKPAEIRESPYLEVIQKMRAIACVPLVTRGHIIGALWIGRAALPDGAPGDITDTDMRLLASIGDVAASAIHRASLHEQTEQRLRRLAALRAVDMAISASIDLRVTLSVLLDQVTTQLEVDASDILILNTQTQSLTFAASRGFRSAMLQQPHLMLGQGFAGAAALERRVISIPHLEESQEKFAVALRTGVEQFASYFAAPLVAKGQVRGVLELFSRKPVEPDPEWVDYLETMAAQAAIAIDNSVMFDDLQRSNTDLIMAYDATIEGWSHTLELRDRETLGHTERVTEITIRLARMMGIREAVLVHVRRGALMHDIGKMGIPDSILHKPGPLTPEEWEIMRQHPQYAYDLLSPVAYLRPALEIPYSHHEKWNGSGYPRGLKEEEIPLAARVFAVVDVWDALRSDRPYRSAWPENRVREYLQAESGKHFDPAVVSAFLRILGD